MVHLLLLLLPLSVFALDPFDLSDEELNPESQDILIHRPEKYLRNESMIYDLNTNLGIKDQRRYTGADRNRFSVAGHINGNYEHLQNLLGFELSYMRRSTRYNQFWYGGQFYQHRTYFGNITQNPTGGTNTNSDSNFKRPNDTKETIMGLGLGVGYRFKLLLDFWQTEDVFENVDVFVNAVQMNESYLGKKYSGYGLTTNYGIHKRSSTSFFYGGKISYNIAPVTRAAIGNESKSERSLSLGWLSLGFEMGFFF